VTVLIIEWADRLGDWLPADHLSVELSYLPGAPSGRRVVLGAGGPRHGELLAALALPPTGGCRNVDTGPGHRGRHFGHRPHPGRAGGGRLAGRGAPSPQPAPAGLAGKGF